MSIWIYYLIFCIATYLTVLIKIYIPVDIMYRKLKPKKEHGILVTILSHSSWALLTMAVAPFVFYSIMRESNADIQDKLLLGMLDDE